MLNSRLAAVGLALALAAAGCGDDDDTEQAETAATQPQTVATTGAEDERAATGDTGTAPVGEADVTLTEFEVAVAQNALPREGVYTLNVANKGKAAHALEAEGPNGETETEEIPPGGSAKLDAYFVSGEYKLYCPIGDHEQRGMTSQLRVRG